MRDRLVAALIGVAYVGVVVGLLTFYTSTVGR